MGEGERGPLLNTFLHRGNVLGTQIRRTLALLLVLLAFSGSILSSVQADIAPTEGEGATLDVLVLDESCLEQETCEPSRPDHFVEYFGADWCEPCKVLDSDLDELIDNETFVMRHHPSPVDLSYNTDSYQRFNNMYRLLFLPSLIHNGNGLLTGTSQAQDLGQVMSNSTTAFEGLSEVSIVNQTLTWNTSTNGTVSVWRLGDVAHETEPYVHSDMVIGAAHFNSTSGQGNISHLLSINGTGLVVMLETDGLRNLTVMSETPAAGLDLIENVDDGLLSSLDSTSSSTQALIATLVLLLLLAPALMMWKNTVAAPKTHDDEQE